MSEVLNPLAHASVDEYTQYRRSKGTLQQDQGKIIMLEPPVFALRTRCFCWPCARAFHLTRTFFSICFIFPKFEKALALQKEATHPAGATNAETPRHATPKRATKIPETRMVSVYVTAAAAKQVSSLGCRHRRGRQANVFLLHNAFYKNTNSS